MTATLKLEPQQKIYTVEEYFEFEKQSEIRHEYVNGKLIAMPGELLPNIKISQNCFRILDDIFEDKGCDTYIFNAKMAVNINNRYRYPDVVVTCQKEPDIRMIQFPSLIVEVLSEGTKHVDKVDKLKEYRTLPTVQYYILVDSEKVEVTVYSRKGKQWAHEIYTSLDEIIPLPFYNVQLPLIKMYKGLEF